MLFNNKLWCKLSAFKAEYYVVSTDFQKEQLSQLGCKNQKIAVIANLVEISNIQNQQIDYRNQFNLNENEDLICYIGHFYHVKGVDILIKAFDEIYKTNQNIKLILAWSGFGYNKKIDALIHTLPASRNIIQLNEIDVFSLLKQVKILVLPYRYTYGTQNLPNLIVEGIATGVPIITSDSTIFKLLKEKNTIITFQKKDINDLQKKITTLLENPLLREDIITAQNEVMNTIYKKERIMNQYVKIFNQLTRR